MVMQDTVAIDSLIRRLTQTRDRQKAMLLATTSQLEASLELRARQLDLMDMEVQKERQASAAKPVAHKST